MGFFSIFSTGKIKEALRNGALVIDVRTAQEYDRGKVPGSVNIPVDRIATSVARIKGMGKPIIFCCSSGIRSRTAKNIMLQHGFKEVYSGGSWEKVLKTLNSL